MSDKLLLQTIGRFIQAQVQLAVAPLIAQIEKQNEEIKLLKALQETVKGFETRALMEEDDVTVMIEAALNARINGDKELGLLCDFDETISAAGANAKRMIDEAIAALPPPPQPQEIDVEEIALKAAVLIPVPKDGEPGKDGKDVDYDKLKEILTIATEKYFESFPVQNGKDCDYLVVAKIVDDAVKDAMSTIPIPKDGENGKPGKDGENGKPGKDGEDGKDGADIVDFIKDDRGHLIVTLSNGKTKDLGQFVGKDGEPGKDGADGFSLEDFTVEFDGKHTATLKFVRGELSKEFKVTFPNLCYQGVFDKELSYLVGDAVTYDGSLWIAKTDTQAVPAEKNSDWQLAVRKGRNGRDGEPGKKGDPGKPGQEGRPGRDLTQLGFNGEKY